MFRGWDRLLAGITNPAVASSISHRLVCELRPLWVLKNSPLAAFFRLGANIVKRIQKSTCLLENSVNQAVSVHVFEAFSGIRQVTRGPVRGAAR